MHFAELAAVENGELHEINCSALETHLGNVGGNCLGSKLTAAKQCMVLIRITLAKPLAPCPPAWYFIMSTRTERTPHALSKGKYVYTICLGFKSQFLA